LTAQAAARVRALIYPVPDPRFPFLGIHYTRKIDGSVDCGPNAVFAFKREGYTRTAFSIRDTMSSLAYPGTWFLFARNVRYGVGEYVRAFSKRLFLRELRRFIPALEPDDIRPGKAGVRAQAVGRTGQPVDDFKIEASQNAIHVLNAPSPAATACLAIGDHICRVAAERLDN
jgi:L-2-hydroxyglutarate oxidase LhgO